MVLAVSCSGMLSLHLNIWMACTRMTIWSACNNWTWSTNSQFHISQLSDVLGLVVLVVWVHPVLGLEYWVGSCRFLKLENWLDKNYDKVYIINPSTRCQCRSRLFKDKTHPFLKSLNKVKDEIISHMVIRWDHGAPIDCSPSIESMRSISSGIYDPHSLKSLASPHYLMGWYQGSNDQAWPNILLLGRISFLANDYSVDNGCQKIHNINAVQV